MRSKHLLLMLLLAFMAPWAVGQQALPYSYGFEDNDLSADGWTTTTGSSSSGIFNAGTSDAHEGSKLFRFYYGESGACLISPKLTGTGTGVDVSLWYRAYSDYYTETFQVGYTTESTPDDLTKFTFEDETTTPSGSTSWYNYLTSFPTGTTYVAIKYKYTNAFYLYLDDFSFTAASPYKKPKNLTVSNISYNSATATWEKPSDATPTGYKYQYKPEGGDWTTLTSTTATTASLAGLTENTTYTFRVKAIYNDGESEFENIDFTTEFACPAPADLEASNITAASATLNWDGSASSYTLKYAAWPGSRSASHLKFADVIKNINRTATDMSNVQVTAAPNAQPNSNTMANQTRDGWYYYDDGSYYTSFGYSGNMFWAVMFPAGTYTGDVLSKIAVYENSSNANPITVYVCDGETAPDNILYSEVFDVVGGGAFHEVTLSSPVTIDPTQNLWLAFYAADNFPATACHSSTETDANGRWCSFDGSTWYDLADVGGDEYYAFMARAYTETLPNTLTWTTVNNITTNEYEMTNLTAETRYAVKVQANCGSEGNSNWATTYFYTLPSCLAPSDLVYTDFTAHTVTLGWTENGDATAWDIEVTGPTTYTVDATTNPYTVSGLQDNTTYSFKVRAKCSDTDFSDWSNHVTVTTDIACYAPENLVMANITGSTANLTWESDANSCDLRYAIAPDATSTNWLVYDNGTFATSIGSSVSTSRTWAVMYPATMLGSNTVLSTLQFYETGSLESYITINIYQDGTTAPESLIYTEIVNPLVVAGWHTVALSDAVTIDPTKNLWIALTATGIYPMPACTVNDANNRWVYSDGEWQQLSSSLSDYGWMIRAYLGTMDWVNVPDLTTYQYTMTNLNPETTYIAIVRSNCQDEGEGYSWWSDINFTTTAACAVDNVTVNNIGHFTATVNWNGESDSFDVLVGQGVVAETYVSENFEGETPTIPSSWTNDSTNPWTIVEGNGGHCIKSGNAGTGSSTSTISFQYTLANDAVIEFDAECMGEGTSSVWDKCIFSIDGTAQFTYGALDEGFNHYSFDVAAGTHTFSWSYSKDSSVNPVGDYFAVDNITLTKKNIEWATPITVTDNTCNLTGLNAGTKYYVKIVPSCNAEIESEVVSFTTVSPNVKWFIAEGNWNVATNWEPEGEPTIKQEVVLKANATIASGTAYAKSISGTGTDTEAKTLTIESGAKLKHLNNDVRATVKKTITGYGAGNEADKANYFLIANPLRTAINATSTPAISATGLLTGTYDLYSFDYTQDDEWRNYETSPFDLYDGSYASHGYLYANEVTTTLTFTGTINRYTGYKSIGLTASTSTTQDFPGWYLLGNPYMYDAYLVNSYSNGTALPYVKMNAAGNGFENVPAGTPIEPMTGFFYQATSSESVYVHTTAPAAPDAGLLNMNLRSGSKQLDNAILAFGSEQKLEKFSFRANSSKIYMPVEGKDYAITNAEPQGEMPVSFKAENNGSYTLSFNTENVEFGYLHLIDNMTGKDVNLLETPSYSFEAKTTDYANRFKLVFSTDSSTSSETFAFISDGNIILNGEGMLQVVDVMGRIMMQEENATHVSTSGMTPGVYVLRLINGDSVKTQKIVIK